VFAAERNPCRILFMNDHVLSIFVDESGRFQHPDDDSRFYILSMVFHNQQVDISAPVREFEHGIEALGAEPSSGLKLRFTRRRFRTINPSGSCCRARHESHTKGHESFAGLARSARHESRTKEHESFAGLARSATKPAAPFGGNRFASFVEWVRSVI